MTQRTKMRWKKLTALKGRPENKSFIVLINSDRMINQCIKDMPEVGWDLMDLSDSPLTMVLEGGQFVAPNVINKDGSLGVRMVKSGSIYQLIRQFQQTHCIHLGQFFWRTNSRFVQ